MSASLSPSRRGSSNRVRSVSESQKDDDQPRKEAAVPVVSVLDVIILLLSLQFQFDIFHHQDVAVVMLRREESNNY